MINTDASNEMTPSNTETPSSDRDGHTSEAPRGQNTANLRHLAQKFGLSSELSDYQKPKPMTEVTWNNNVPILEAVAKKHGLQFNIIGREGDEFTHTVDDEVITTKVSPGHTLISITKQPEVKDLEEFWKDVHANKEYTR